MKLSNFKLLERLGSDFLNWRFRASVTVETGFIFKKTEVREIQKKYGFNWYFSDNGKFTPGNDVVYLEKAFEAKHMKGIEKIAI